MFRHLRIQNFKCWQDTGPIRMAPLTLFFGANSSGKSSLGHFLMMLKQTAQLADCKTVLFPGSKESAVQLGTDADMLHQRDVSRKMSFEYSWDLNAPHASLEPGDRISFSASAGLEARQHLVWVLDQFRYRLLQQEQQRFAVGMQRTKDGSYSFQSEGYNLTDSDGEPTRFYGFPDTAKGTIRELQLQHEAQLRAINYLGPIRTKAERLYSWAGIEPDSVGASGELTVAALLAASPRMLDVGAGETPFSAVVAASLLQLDLIDEFKVNPISPQNPDYDVQVRTKGSLQWVDLADTGFGLSQILPVLVEGFYAPAYSTIIVEQPELHLHPRSQSELADVLISMVQAKESGAPRHIQLIVETHSEHFLRRLQRRIAEDKIPQGDVAAYFAEMTQSGSKLSPLAIDDYGNISNWPKGFFGEEMDDVIQHGKAAVQKRLRQLGQP